MKWLNAFVGVYTLGLLGMWIFKGIPISNFLIGLWGFSFAFDCFMRYYIHTRMEVRKEQIEQATHKILTELEKAKQGEKDE